MALPRSRSYLGIAKETRPTPGSSPTAASATDFIPFTTITPFDNITYLDDKGIRGSMSEEFNVIQGKIHSEFDVAGDVFPDTIGYIYSGVLGDVVTTGASAPYTHNVALLNSQASNGQPPTFTLSDYYSLGSASTRQYAGTQFASIDTKFSADALLTYSAKAFGFKSVTAANPTPSFSTLAPLPSWTGTVSLGGSVTAVVSEGNVNISRPVTPIHTVDDTQNPYQLFAGPVTVEGSLMLVLESDAQLNYYLNNTQPVLAIDFASGAGASAVQVKFNMTKAAFTVAKIERGKDYIELNVNYKALANTTDAGASAGYSPIKVTLQNAKVSGTYA
jgi:hypothetical protein